jgi:hypothetical protein
MDSFSKIIQLTTEKVDTLNAAIDALEEELHQKTIAERAGFIEKKKNDSVLSWLWRMKTPKVYTPTWYQDQSRIIFRALLETEQIELNQLAAQLNLYTLNSAIYLVRLKADKSLALHAEELRQLSEQLRNISISSS